MKLLFDYLVSDVKENNTQGCTEHFNTILDYIYVFFNFFNFDNFLKTEEFEKIEKSLWKL